MITKNRIAIIRLSKKLDDNPSYAKQIGVSVEYRKAEDQRLAVQRSRENDFLQEVMKMGKNRLDIINFSKIYDMFGEEAARDTLNDVNEGRVLESTLEKYLYTDETKDEYAVRLKKE